MASRQDKATADRNAKTLRELVKMPQNKFCADCKRNDARWASWNIGCFVCIRCSGIHRSMGTHISKVKSVDLDMWTPEQMASVQKWGNARVNLYWEAHLKPGHMPPDHKMDSFIRSKYESRRWAMEGPPPSDPSVLEGTAEQARTETPAATPASPPQAAPRSSVALPAPPVANNVTISHNPSASGSRTTHTLLSSAHTRNPSIPPPGPNPNAPTPAAAAPTTANELFSLDFSASAPSQPSNLAAKKDVKQDILSLFSSAPSPAPVAQSSLFGAPLQQQPQMQSQSLMGSGGAAMWGADSWSSGVAAVPPAMAGANVWATPQMQYNNPATGMQNVWATAGGGGPSRPVGGGFDMFNTPAPVKPAPKQDDAFGDLWGSFK